MVGIIPADTREYRTYVSDPNMIWPDGVTYISDGFMYVGAAQLIQTGVFQSDATPSGTANNAPPYRIYGFPSRGSGYPWVLSIEEQRQGPGLVRRTLRIMGHATR